MSNWKIEATIKIDITTEDIDDIMCSALEGGITYWCCRAEVVGDYLQDFASEQIARGGTLLLHDAEEDEIYELTLDKLVKGIKMAIEHGDYAEYGWYTNGELDTCSVDADVADVIIQYALFDTIMFG